MSEDKFCLDGTVIVEDIIYHKRIVPQIEYFLTVSLDYLTKEQQLKVLKYSVKLGGNRFNCPLLRTKKTPIKGVKLVR